MGNLWVSVTIFQFRYVFQMDKAICELKRLDSYAIVGSETQTVTLSLKMLIYIIIIYVQYSVL